MLEIGQPLHPFDLALLKGPAIVVRRARDGEMMVTLDDVERTFTEDDLLICDAERPSAWPASWEARSPRTSDATDQILLEAASFERGGIQRTRRRIDLSTEASMRFERGVDPEAASVGADRACRLMVEWCGARVLRGAIEAGAVPARRHVTMRASRASKRDRLRGLARGRDRGLRPAADAVRPSGDDDIDVEIPGYRVDIEREVDLIEEVVRVQGYDRVGLDVAARCVSREGCRRCTRSATGYATRSRGRGSARSGCSRSRPTRTWS